VHGDDEEAEDEEQDLDPGQSSCVDEPLDVDGLVGCHDHSLSDLPFQLLRHGTIPLPVRAVQVDGRIRLAGSGKAPAQPTSSREANSPIMMLGALVLAAGIVGMTEASAMRRPWTPRTRSSASTTASAPDPIAQVPTGWR